MAEREHVYVVEDAIEVDQVDGYEVTRRRVFLSDIEAVTMHQQRQIYSLIMLGLVLLTCLAVIVAVNSHAADKMLGLLISSAVTAPFLWLFVRLLLVPTRIINIYGTRTKASLRFVFRVAKAEKVFHLICDRVSAKNSAS